MNKPIITRKRSKYQITKINDHNDDQIKNENNNETNNQYQGDNDLSPTLGGLGADFVTGTVTITLTQRIQDWTEIANTEKGQARIAALKERERLLQQQQTEQQQAQGGVRAELVAFCADARRRYGSRAGVNGVK